MFHHFGGISFSGAREPLSNVWTALGGEEDGRLCIRSLRPHAYRADLCAFVAAGWRDAIAAEAGTRALWGVDFPCGLPAAAGRHLLGSDADWRAVARWVADRPPDEVRDEVPDELRGARLGDAGGPAPLDSRAYKQTVEGLRWLYELVDEHRLDVAPQTGEAAEGVILEVLPQLSVRELGLPRRRAPGRAGETRARAAALRTFVHFADAETEAAAVTLENAWDATVACITAYLSRDDLRQPFRVSDHPEADLRLEGWVYRPPASIG